MKFFFVAGLHSRSAWFAGSVVSWLSPPPHNHYLHCHQNKAQHSLLQPWPGNSQFPTTKSSIMGFICSFVPRVLPARSSACCMLVIGREILEFLKLVLKSSGIFLCQEFCLLLNDSFILYFIFNTHRLDYELFQVASFSLSAR